MKTRYLAEHGSGTACHRRANIEPNGRDVHKLQRHLAPETLKARELSVSMSGPPTSGNP
jgi:hypothetical protein